MDVISATLFTFQDAKPSPLNKIAAKNMSFMFVTLEVSQVKRLILPWKDDANLNMLAILCTLLVFHDETSPLKASAAKNMEDISVTLCVFHGRSWLKLGAL